MIRWITNIVHVGNVYTTSPYLFCSGFFKWSNLRPNSYCHDTLLLQTVASLRSSAELCCCWLSKNSPAVFYVIKDFVTSFEERVSGGVEHYWPQVVRKMLLIGSKIGRQGRSCCRILTRFGSRYFCDFLFSFFLCLRQYIVADPNKLDQILPDLS